MAKKWRELPPTARVVCSVCVVLVLGLVVLRLVFDPDHFGSPGRPLPVGTAGTVLDYADSNPTDPAIGGKWRVKVRSVVRDGQRVVVMLDVQNAYDKRAGNALEVNLVTDRGAADETFPPTEPSELSPRGGVNGDCPAAVTTRLDPGEHADQCVVFTLPPGGHPAYLDVYHEDPGRQCYLGFKHGFCVACALHLPTAMAPPASAST